MRIPASIIVIGLHSERPRSGKSTVAQAITCEHDGMPASIADLIRQTARDIGFPEAADALGDNKDVPHPALGGLTPRQILIAIGESRCSRNGRTYWIDACLTAAVNEMPDGGVIVIDDVRRFEEGQRLVDLGATVCTITRDDAPDVVDINGWRSGLSYTFRNDGTPDECAARIWARAQRDRRAT